MGKSGKSLSQLKLISTYEHRILSKAIQTKSRTAKVHVLLSISKKSSFIQNVSKMIPTKMKKTEKDHFMLFDDLKPDSSIQSSNV